MSSSVNSNAVDRQLKKIYDCLNIGSNKKAVQEVDRLPKNLRDLTVFKTLKSLALIRMQKFLQAFEILDEINLDADLDEVTLQTITSCCKESVNVGKIVEMYEAASRRKPNDPDILSHLFMAYVRVFDFKRQKEIAMQLYKNFPIKKRLHSFWAIMSLVMQSQATNETSSTPNSADVKVCLSLAEKMCEKMIDDERTQEEIELYLLILRKQNKHEEEYKFLTGPICSRLTDHLSWYKRRQAYLCQDLKMYSRAFKHYFPTLIQEYPDQVEYYQGLFKSAFLLDTEAPSQQQPVALTDQQNSQTQSVTGTPVKFTSALAECFDIVERQCQLCLESQDQANKDVSQKNPRTQTKNLSRTSSLNPCKRGLLRGPFMARIELYNMILTNESLLPANVFNLSMKQFTSKYPKLINLPFDYIRIFSKKLICHYDLDYMLNRYNLSAEDKVELVNMVDDWVESIIKNPQSPALTNGEVMKAYDIYHVQLNCHMLRHSLRDYKTSDSMSDRLKLAKEFIDIYDEQRELCKSSNSKTEFLAVDHYCLLIINSIMANFIDINMINQLEAQPILTDSLIVSLIVLAESAASNSPSNHHIKLILLKLYSLIGASKQCSDTLVSLEIKHFQIDTMGHLLNPVLYNTGNYNLSKDSLDTCLGFYSLGIRECFECLTLAYREGRFSKIEEISNVLGRLTNSLNAAQCFLLKGVINNVTATAQDELVLACKSFSLSNGLRVFRQEHGIDSIKDSRDFKVLKSLHFETNNLLQQRQQETLADEKLWLKLRYSLLQSAFKQYELFVVSKSSMGQSKKGNNSRINSQLADLESMSKQVDELVGIMLDVASKHDDHRYSYLEPDSSPFKWKNIKFKSLIDLVRPLVFCTNPLDLTQDFLDKYSAKLDECVNNIERQMTTISSLIALKQVLSSLTITLEFLSLCVTSLVSLNQAEIIGNNCANEPSLTSSSAAKSAANQATNSHQSATKTKSTLSQIMNKIEAQLLKISNLIKGFDLKSLSIDKMTHIEKSLMSDTKHNNIELKDGLLLKPIMGPDAQSLILNKVKEMLLDSYSESLKEIENACRRKIKLLRSKP